MTAELLDGAPVARELMERARDELAWVLQTSRTTPLLAIVRVGKEKSSVAYERSIARTARSAGITIDAIHLPADSEASQLAAAIQSLNRSAAVNGIIVLQPLPAHLSRFSVADVIDPRKDVDGITTYNAGRLFHDDRDVLAPSTPAGGMALLKHYEIALSGAHAVIVGRSSVVGKPMALMLLAEHATVTICHSRTRDLAAVCREADILVSAAGQAGLITADYVRARATVVDFGVNFVNGCMVGDVDAESVRKVAGKLTPVPGGTGRVTTTVVVRNTIKAAIQQTDSGW